MNKKFQWKALVVFLLAFFFTMTLNADFTADQYDRRVIYQNQIETPEDSDITQKIRYLITSDSFFSPMAKNIQIISRDGEVTLAGIVENEKERSLLIWKAKQVTGVRKIKDELEILRRQ